MPFSDGARRPDEPVVGFALAIATPRAAARITALSTAGILASGSSPQAAFPISPSISLGRVLPVADGRKLADYSCGGSHGVAHRSARTAFPFDPRAGHRLPLDSAISNRMEPWFHSIGNALSRALMTRTLPPIVTCMAAANDEQARHK